MKYLGTVICYSSDVYKYVSGQAQREVERILKDWNVYKVRLELTNTRVYVTFTITGFETNSDGSLQRIGKTFSVNLRGKAKASPMNTIM